MTEFTNTPTLHPQTVSELTSSIRGLLETTYSFVAVVGEISNLRQAHSGHYYFSLKDEQAQLRAVLFKQRQRYLASPPLEGAAVICRGRLTVYEPRGEYQLMVDHLEAKGAGELQIAFEQLKKRLAAEGLFASERKRPLPFLPEVVALVTSPTGAAVFDFLHMAAARFPSVPIEIHPVRVQGPGAAEEIVRAIDEVNSRRKAGVLVLCRGGGSLEDLWTFNEEKVARAIRGSRLPVVCAVGHEVDYTIADLAADFRAPTPTAAAEAVLPLRSDLRIRVGELGSRLVCTMNRKLAAARFRVDAHRRLLGDPSFLLTHFLLVLDHRHAALINATVAQLRERRAHLDKLQGQLLTHGPFHLVRYLRHRCVQLTSRLHAAMARNLERRHQGLASAAGLLEAVSPLAVLGRGYAVVRAVPHHQVVRQAAQVRPGDDIEVLLQEGALACRVLKVTE